MTTTNGSESPNEDYLRTLQAVRIVTSSDEEFYKREMKKLMRLPGEREE